MTRPVTVGKAGPRLEAGGRFGATLAANDRRLAEVSLTLSGSSVTGGFVNALPMLHSRWMPSIDPSQPDALSELVTMRSQDVELGPVYTGDPTVELFDAPGDELSLAAAVRDDRRLLATGRRDVLRRDQARMRLVRFRFGDRIATGAIDAGSDDIRILRGTFFEDPIPTGEHVPLDDVRLLAPVLPSKIVCVGQELRGACGRVRR